MASLEWGTTWSAPPFQDSGDQDSGEKSLPVAHVVVEKAGFGWRCPSALDTFWSVSSSLPLEESAIQSRSTAVKKLVTVLRVMSRAMTPSNFLSQ